jgi:hypothetical protein
MQRQSQGWELRWSVWCADHGGLVPAFLVFTFADIDAELCLCSCGLEPGLVSGISAWFDPPLELDMAGYRGLVLTSRRPRRSV